MEYNTRRENLRIPELGRCIQKIVDYCKSLKTKQERTEMAHWIIELMGSRNPQFRQDENSEPRKLWDHLFILADYELDIDAPYPMPLEEERYIKPKKMSYPDTCGEYKFYGKSILRLIELAISLKDGEEKEALIYQIANNMKKSYNIYNRENVEDQVIFRHLKELSNDKLEINHLDLGSLDRNVNYQNKKRTNSNNQNTAHRKNFTKNKKPR